MKVLLLHSSAVSTSSQFKAQHAQDANKYS